MTLGEKLHFDFKGIKQNAAEERSFFSTLSISFLIVSIISSVLLTTLLAAVFIRSMTQSVRNNTQQLLSQTNYAIEKINEDANRLEGFLFTNNGIMSYLSLPEPSVSGIVQAQLEVNKMLITMPYVQSVYLYNARIDNMYCSDTGHQVPLDSVKDQEMFARLEDPSFAESYDGRPLPGQLDESTEAAEVITYYYFIGSGAVDNRQSAIIVNFDISVLIDPISSIRNLSFDSASNFILLDSSDTFLTGVLNLDISDEKGWAEEALKTADSPDFYVSVDGKTYLKTGTDNNSYGWTLLNFTPLSSIFQNYLFIMLMCLLVMILVLIISWFICRRFAKQLNQPLEALSHIVKGKNPKDNRTFETKEFRTIMETVTSLYENNEQLRSLQHKSRYSLIQSTLNDLITDHHLAPPQQVHQDLEYLGLTYLETGKLCMTVFKMDNYRQVLSSHSSDEMWALRFSVVNIVEELGSASFTCSAFSHDDDKFILLTACPPDDDLVAFENHLLELFKTVQENISKYLHFTMTAAYSPVFQGTEQLPMYYRRTADALHLKMRYGHEAVIDPYQSDEIQPEVFQFSAKYFSQLCDQLAAGQFEAAWEVYEKLTDHLFEADYNDITATVVRLAHGVYERLSEKYPMLQEPLMNSMKLVIAGLEDAEVREDIDNLSKNFFRKACEEIQQIKENPAQQKAPLLVARIIEIIEEEYADPTLCLAGIAEKIGLSSNYTGHIFKQHTQKSVAQYLLDVRMDKVAYYIQNTNLPLTKILEKVGLEKNNYFYTRFKNYFGMSLGDYRQKFQAKGNE
ncbi:hypothetical protein B5F07_14730 [Lachnoclostridium sp. An169]|uniref:helix-turn-helix transcriptional regulator n=1 Tax=Lachnoclostridium sp. An169 TaxID=1965569 RepID=UPI000B393AFE|nr:helix-turn-helix domain-containing protein [Lachnoclostridium sp. An169]OUP82179.1 hypothetical protein B5F07_14730 [Lachnoclostridium sp. An169]